MARPAHRRFRSLAASAPPFPSRRVRRRGLWPAGLWLALSFLPLDALAVPPHAVVVLAEGDDTILPRPPGAEWTATLEGPALVDFEILEANEVFFQARKTGITHLLWQNRSLPSVQVWEIRVGTGAKEPRPIEVPAAAAACCQKTGDGLLECQISGESCLGPAGELLTHPELDPGKAQVRYTPAGLQALLARMEKALHEAGLSGVRLAFHGAVLVVQGEVANEDSRRRVLMVLYRNMIGKLLVEDRLRLPQSGEKAP